MGGIGNGTPDVVKGTDKDTDVAVVVGLDKDTRSVSVNLWTWDPNTSSYVRIENPKTIMEKMVLLLGDGYWLSVQRDYDVSGNLVYVGKNVDPNTSDDDVNWHITRHYWVEVKNKVWKCVRERSRMGSWTDRTLNW